MKPSRSPSVLRCHRGARLSAQVGQTTTQTSMSIHANHLQVVPYDPGWPAAFEAEASRLRTALGTLALRIDHNGSTAIPGLSAKPIIDIQVSVAALQPIAAYGERLRAIGYVHLPHADDSFCPFFHRPSQWPHSHHVHVVEGGGAEERRTLAFRDYLRDHVTAAREYEHLKQDLARQFSATAGESREAYSLAKTDFVRADCCHGSRQRLSARVSPSRGTAQQGATPVGHAQKERPGVSARGTRASSPRAPDSGAPAGAGTT
jgi:GrpB-like predicted nucleotidyltransferase (UPF0157 family)